MKLIMKLVDKMEEEINDADSYYDCAVKYSDYPELSRTLKEIANQELMHFQMLHNRATEIITKMKSSRDIDDSMLAAYDYLHDRLVNHVNKVKFKIKELD